MSTQPGASNPAVQDSARLTDTATDDLFVSQGAGQPFRHGLPTEHPQTSREDHQPVDRHYEFSQLFSAALSVLTPKEQLRLAKVLGQSSVGECVDALWCLCTFESSKAAEEQLHEAHTEQNHENGGIRGWNGAQAVQPETNAHHVQPESLPGSVQQPTQNENPSWRSWQQQGWATTPVHIHEGGVASPPLSVQEPPWGTSQPSPSLQVPKDEPITCHKRSRAPTQKIIGGGLSYYDAYDSEESPRSLPKPRASPKPRKKSIKDVRDSRPGSRDNDDSDASDIKKIPKKSAPKTPRKRLTFKQRPYPATEASATVFRALHDGEGGTKLPDVAPSRSSFRDRVWDLLHESEKTQIVSGQMGASEGVKRLLARRAAALGCDIKDIPDEDTWDIGMKLSQNKSSSEPLAEPRKCCLCLREGTVTTKHNYYCRRCQLIYRAIHRKKMQPDWQQALAVVAGATGAPVVPENAENTAAANHTIVGMHSDENDGAQR